MSNLKKGDRVVYTGEDRVRVTSLIGKLGVVQRVIGKTATVLFDDAESDDDSYHVGVGNLTREEPRFHVGQLVRCQEDNDPGYQFTAGEVYEVSAVEGGSFPRISVVADDAGDDNGWGTQFFEPAVVEGSRIKVRDAHWDIVIAGKGATVKRIRDDAYPRALLLEVDAPFEMGHAGFYRGEFFTAHSMRGWWTDEKDIDLIPIDPEPTAPAPAVRDAIVCLLDDDGLPLPALAPYVHANRASAITESERLAAKNPGKNFAVYEAVSLAYAPSPPPQPKPVATSVAL